MAAATSKTGNARWYDEPKNDVHDCLVGVFQVVADECGWRIDADEYHAGLYSACDKPGVKGESRRDYEYGPATLPYNVCRSATQTLVAKIAQHRPLPEVLTQRGNWKSQKKARKMTQFLEGEFYRQKIFERHSATILRDALIFGRGILKIWVDGKNVRTERVFPWELFVDEWDGRYGEPRNVYHCRSMDRGVAIETFARTDSGAINSRIRDRIDSAGRFNLRRGDDHNATPSTVDRVDILEAWHLPSAPGAKDGRHVIICQGATLVDEPWTYDYFPFSVVGYDDAVVGFWAHGLVEQLEGYQYEINLTSEKLSEQYRMSGKLIMVPDGSGIHTTNIRNGLTICGHRPGMRPDVFDMDLVNEHTRQRPRELTQDALNESGLSQMSVQSQKPQGVTAAVALQTLDDIETERFMIFGRAYEAWCLDIGRKLIDCAKKIAAEFGDLAVSVPMKGGLVDLNWKDVAIDGIELRIFATSLLPQQLSARLDRLTSLWESGLIDRATFLRHLDAPDMQAELDLETADRLLIDEVLEAMLEAEEDDGDRPYIAPSSYQDLQWAGRRAQQKLNRAQLDGAPEYNLAFLRRYLKQVDQLKAQMGPTGPVANDASAAPLNPTVGGPPMPGGPAPNLPAPPPPMGVAA